MAEPEGLVENMSQLVSEHCCARNAPFPANRLPSRATMGN
jgi:hypothetical protein